MRTYLKSCAISLLVVWAAPARADVVVSSQATQNVSCSGGVCVPTAANAVLNVSDLENLLASGNVEVTTTGPGIQANDIKLQAALSWSATSTLALDAYQSIAVDKAVTLIGSGGLTIVTNDGGKNGTFSFGPKGKVKFRKLASPLVIDGVSFTLIKSLPSLAAAVAANPKGAYALANSYDAAQDGTYGACPIGTLDGIIEGLGNTISNLSIDIGKQDGDDALVDIVSAGALIENLRLSGLNYKADSPDYNAAGGLVAQNEGTLFGDSASGSIDSAGENQQDAAGIAGYNSPTGTIDNNSANVSVAGKLCSCGGLVGFNFGAIELSSAQGAVSGGAAGGLVGQSEGPVSQSFATGAVGGDYAGGLIGINNADVTTGTASDSYATGKVTGGAGGFVGDDQGGLISTSYSTGTVPSGDGGFECSGGSISFTSDYWDLTTSGTQYGSCDQVDINGITGLTTKQLQKKLPHGFSRKIWALNPKLNNGFPYLIANLPSK